MEASSYKLYTPQGSFRAFAPLIAAEYSRISVEVLTDGIEEAVRSKSPTGKAPFLENIKTGDIIFSSHAMARYLGGARKDSGLMGRNFNETASVNRWVDWCQQDVELPCCILFYPVAGYMPRSEEAHTSAEADLRATLKVMEEHLVPRKYLVTDDQITLADIVLACTLLYPFKLICDDEYLKPFGNVVRWFQNCVAQPELVAVLGKVVMCKK